MYSDKSPEKVTANTLVFFLTPELRHHLQINDVISTGGVTG